MTIGTILLWNAVLVTSVVVGLSAVWLGEYPLAGICFVWFIISLIMGDPYWSNDTEEGE